jgi:hypothetical protein
MALPVDLLMPDPVNTTTTPDGVQRVFAFFRTEGLPQEITLPTGGAVSGTSIVSSDQLPAERWTG